jgi:hypothetical protein
VVFRPQWFMNDLEGMKVASAHGSPWRYDTFVPVVFAGIDLTGRRIHRAIEPVDIAPTLAAILAIKQPSGSRGVPLQEVIQGLGGDPARK